MTEKVLYAELIPQEFRERLAAAPIAYLPLGTIEWHGEHLPLGTDGFQPLHLFQKLAEKVGGIVLPMLFVGPDRMVEEEGRELYGMDAGQLRPPGIQYPNQQLAGSAYRVSDDLFGQLFRAILKQIARAGFKILVAHGHGPSGRYFSSKFDEWKRDFGLDCFHCWEWTEEGDTLLSFQTGHAGVNETSTMMAAYPHLVQMNRLSAEPNEFPLGTSPDDARDATPEHGQAIINHQIERMSAILTKALAALS